MQTPGSSGTELVQLRHFTTVDPDEFATRLDPVATGVHVATGDQGKFRADVFAAPLTRLGVFTVRIRHARVGRDPERYVAITVPASRPLEFFRGDRGTAVHPGSAHVLHREDPLDLRVGPDSGLFVATLQDQWIDTTARRLTDRESYRSLLEDEQLDLTTRAGRTLRDFLDFIWAETCRGGAFTRSQVALREIENTFATLLVLASEAQARRGRSDESGPPSHRPIEKAEEYLRANLLEPFALDQLIEITGLSASTLLREFKKRHGMPPMQYLRQRRLEAARRELLSAEPDETTVTDVATAYGFYHLGRFSGRYRETYGELPSETLRRR